MRFTFVLWFLWVPFVISSPPVPLFVDVDNLLFGNPETREMAWEKLKGAPPQQAIQIVLERVVTERRGRRLDDAVSARNLSILEGLARFKGSGLPPFIALLKNGYYVSRRDFDSLSKYFTDVGAESVEPLLELLSFPQMDVRKMASSALAQLGETAEPRLCKELKSQDSTRRYGALSAIAQSKIPEPKRVSALIEALSDKDHFVGGLAERKLIEMGKSAGTALEARLAGATPAQEKAYRRVLHGIHDAQHVRELEADRASASPLTEGARDWTGTYEVKRTEPAGAFGRIEIEWNGSLRGRFTGEEDFGEHGAVYYREEILDARISTAGRLSFEIGPRHYYRSLTQLGAAETSGRGNSVLTFYCAKRDRGLQCRCTETGVRGCAYIDVSFVKQTK